MGYLYLLCVALMFSFGGTCVKLIKPYFGPSYITCFRFLVGVVFLLLLKIVKRQKFPDHFLQILKANACWILFGAVAKWLSYWLENYGLTHGPSYGNIITQPAQTVFITLSSVFLFREKLGFKRVICILMCMFGVLCVSWNGRPVSVFFHENIYLTLFFLLAGVLAGGHVLAQKMIADKMDIVDSNLSIFAVSAVLSSAVQLPDVLQGGLVGIHPNVVCFLAIIGFGIITGLGFYLNAKAIPLVPFYMVPVIQSTMAVFSITWAVLFFHETISIYIIGGTAAFLLGLIGLQLFKERA